MWVNNDTARSGFYMCINITYKQLKHYFLLKEYRMDVSIQTDAPPKKYPSQLDPAKRRQYYSKFYAKKQELGTITCPICFGHYTYFNKYHHNKGVHHQRALDLKRRIDEGKNPKKYLTLDAFLSLEDLEKMPMCSSGPASCVGDSI